MYYLIITMHWYTTSTIVLNVFPGCLKVIITYRPDFGKLVQNLTDSAILFWHVLLLYTLSLL